MGVTTGRGFARIAAGAPLALSAALWLGGCAVQGPVNLSPEASLPACESEALKEAQRIDSSVQGVELASLDATRVERRSPPPGKVGVGLVMQGEGTEIGGGTGGFRYACLVGTTGDVLFVSLMPQGTGKVMQECSGPTKNQRACLRGLAADADRALAQAEAEAVKEARRAAGKAKRSEVDEPAAASIGAWRVYRDAECSRRYGRAGDVDRETACSVQLTRARVAELRE